jgi:hypothetical protein
MLSGFRLEPKIAQKSLSGAARWRAKNLPLPMQMAFYKREMGVGWK